jgi:hypothetical protein
MNEDQEKPGAKDCPHGRALGFCPHGCDVPYVDYSGELKLLPDEPVSGTDYFDFQINRGKK